VAAYLVERYWPGVTSELLLEALNRGRRVMEQMRAEGTPLRDVTSILIPAEEVVFSVYEGQSAAAVRQLNERAGIPVSRIVEAIAVTGGQGLLARADQYVCQVRLLADPASADGHRISIFSQKNVSAGAPSLAAEFTPVGFFHE
jgi:hypothetical protein